MNKELEIWQFAAERLKRDESVMLLVVAESSGSSPGRRGFKMIVARDELCGSIGGGVMEVALVRKAKLRITNYELRIKSEIIEQVHRKSSPDSSGMICSGRQAVILCELKPADLETVLEIIDSLENHRFGKLRITNYELRIINDEKNISDFPFDKLT